MAVYKLRMQMALEAYQDERTANAASDGNAERDEIIQSVQDRLLELSDKFDRFLST